MAAFRTELFSAEFVDFVLPGFTGRGLPLAICFYLDEGDDIYGDRICNNALAGAIITILVCMVLMMIDLQIPCTTPMVCVSA